MDSAILFYLTPLVLLVGGYIFFNLRKEKRARNVMEAAAEAGLIEPPSLHPTIDPMQCLGCGACATACPEGNVIGLIKGKAVLIEPTHCIGHGACAKACPTEAISLVFGTERRGVDIPFVDADFQTNVPGIYIAGELGGMGLIRNAIEQGRQAIEAVSRASRKAPGGFIDVLIVGAGPAGFSATLGAKKLGLKSVTIEQESLGGTVAHYPRGKIVMTSPVDLPIIGKVKLKETSKESLLEFWQSAEKKSNIKINYQERLEDAKAITGGFEVTTTKGTYRTGAILLAIGRRGTPRKLGVPGEELSKVVYRMIDPEQFSGRNVLVVGGGDSALEAAAEIAEQDGTKVVLSYRSEAFSRARQKNRARVDALAEQKKIFVVLSSQIDSIGEGYAVIARKGATKKIANDDVIICAGGVLPTGFLKSIGIEVETKRGAA